MSWGNGRIRIAAKKLGKRFHNALRVPGKRRFAAKLRKLFLGGGGDALVQNL